ncbi:MAG: hypothetical protein KF753_00680 [Caldilineaceae bacterium]|nr:hypothetical protein [Caldilineaceae bacterium]
MTPEMLDVLLPMLGFSIVLNILLAAMLLFRPLAKLVGRFVSSYLLGLQLMLRN